MGWTREDVIRVWKNPECRSTHSVSAVHPSGVGLLEMGNEELQEALGAGDVQAETTPACIAGAAWFLVTFGGGVYVSLRWC